MRGAEDVEPIDGCVIPGCHGPENLGGACEPIEKLAPPTVGNLFRVIEATGVKRPGKNDGRGHNRTG